jgi:hypothetical protein
MSLDTVAPLAFDSAAHLYTMPDTGSVHTASDLEALEYLSGSLSAAARRMVRNPIPLVDALRATAHLTQHALLPGLSWPSRDRSSD